MNIPKFEGKTVLVTGAGNGIGFEICRQFARQGANVALNDLDGELAKQAAESICAEGSSCFSIPGDASDPEFISRLVSTTVERFGRLDIAIANAGLTSASTILDITPESLRRMLDLNLQGSVFLTQAASKQMISQGDGGRIILMSSVTGHQAHDLMVCYGMTKAALQMLAKGLVLELAPHGITSNAISPGAVVTERTIGADPQFEKKWEPIIPTKKVSQTIDIANAALFLASPEASQITGQTLIVDGGWTSTSQVPDFSSE